MHRKAFRRVLAIAGAAVTLALPITSACAASLSIDPTTTVLTVARAQSVLRVSNMGDEDVRVQARALAWATDGVAQSESDTDEIVISPPIFTVAPNQTQTVRLGIRATGDGRSERAWRIVLDEVPATERTNTASGGVRTLLRVSVPVFLSPISSRIELSWQLQCQAGAARLVATNSGNVHAKFVSIGLLPAAADASRANADAPLWQTGLTYVLPGQARAWQLPASLTSAGQQRLLRVQTASGSRDVALAPSDGCALLSK